MKKIRVKYFAVGMLLILEVISLTLMYKSSHNKEVVLDEVKLKELIKNDMISIMTDETGNGTYTEYSSNTFPSSYIYNASKSQCINEKGNIVNNVLKFDGTNAILTSNEGMHCTLYFDKCGGPKGTVLDGKTGISKCEVGGMYRYQGADNVNNYICFGTWDKSTCTSSTGKSKYLYRIIGVTPDNHLKLMKENDIGIIYWTDNNSSYVSSTNLFYESNLYNKINTSSFLQNTSYVPSSWSNKIYSYKYYYGYSNNFTSVTAEDIYKIETGQINSSGVVGTPSGAAIGVGDVWESNNFKIALPYVHDYLYSIANNTSNCSSSGSCSNSWMNYSKSYPTMSICGTAGLGAPCGIWYINNTGQISYTGTAPQTAIPMFNIKPTFYLNSDITISSGTGSSSDPYIISTTLLEKLREKDTKKQLTANLVGGMYRYQGTDNVNNYICFGTSNKSTCTSGTINYGDGVDKYLYRIIGITETGELAILKQNLVKESSSIDSFQKNDKNSITDCGSDGLKCTWKDSSLYRRINGISTENTKGSDGTSNIFIGNSYYEYLTSENVWFNLINNHTWKYGILNDDSESQKYTYGGDYNGDLVYAIENNFKDAIQSKIGLLYIHDYYYAYPGGHPKDSSTLINAWISLHKDYRQSEKRLGVGDWLMPISTPTDYIASWSWYSNVMLENTLVQKEWVGVRPVFYLKPNVNISSGSGSKTDPFIITP